MNSDRHVLGVKLGVTTPAWSPDVRRLAFYCWPPADRPALCIVDADGRHLRRLATNVPEDLTAYSRGTLKLWDARTGKGHAVTGVDGPFQLVPAWSADAKRIYFTSSAE